ncbi:MAG: nucleotidyl transferase AbiEii/AbiGii toxin family protein [Candidatus Omnitrophota bacterium]
MYNSLQLRELFHLEFLRWFGRKTKANFYALKGGSNLRFFFNSFRYSEDMDLDIREVEVNVLKDTVMQILKTSSFCDILKSFGIVEIVPPNITRAKQTETTQRFKVHLLTSAGEDLFTKIEFSRRGFKGRVVTQPVEDIVLRMYKLVPLLVPHYDIQSAIIQKIEALAGRTVIQARDIFDLYVLNSQYDPLKIKKTGVTRERAKKAYENIFAVNFEQFRDTVVFYLSHEDQAVYNSAVIWDEIRLKVSNSIERMKA